VAREKRKTTRREEIASVVTRKRGEVAGISSDLSFKGKEREGGGGRGLFHSPLKKKRVILPSLARERGMKRNKKRVRGVRSGLLRVIFYFLPGGGEITTPRKKGDVHGRGKRRKKV